MARTRRQSRSAADAEQRNRDLASPAGGSPIEGDPSPESRRTPTDPDESGSSTRTDRGPLAGIVTAPLEPSLGDTAPRAYLGSPSDRVQYDAPECSTRRAGKAPAVDPAPPPDSSDVPPAPYTPPPRRQPTPQPPRQAPQQSQPQHYRQYEQQPYPYTQQQYPPPQQYPPRQQYPPQQPAYSPQPPWVQ